MNVTNNLIEITYDIIINILKSVNKTNSCLRILSVNKYLVKYSDTILFSIFSNKKIYYYAGECITVLDIRSDKCHRDVYNFTIYNDLIRWLPIKINNSQSIITELCEKHINVYIFLGFFKGRFRISVIDSNKCNKYDNEWKYHGECLLSGATKFLLYGKCPCGCSIFCKN